MGRRSMLWLHALRDRRHREKLLSRQIHLVVFFCVFLPVTDQLVVIAALDDESAFAFDDFSQGRTSPE